jgi:glycosyltransferase involved in cell wall biosynthesis
MLSLIPGPWRRRRDRLSGKLRILHIFSYFRPDFTGEGLYFEKIEPRLADHGVVNSVLVLATVEKEAARSSKDPAVKTPGFSVEYLAKAEISALRISTSLFGWAVRHARHYHLVHFHSHGDRYFLGKIALRLFGCRIVQSCTLDDSPAELVNSYSRPFRPAATMLMRIIDLFIVISPRLSDSALPGTRMRFIPQGVALPLPSTRSREGERDQFGFAADDLLLLFVGAVTARKDVLFLVEMMPRLRRIIPELKLVVVGPVFEDEYGARFGARIAELGLSDCVCSVGYIDDPGPYFRICDIFVFASHQEGFGNVIIEAMAYRLPVVARLLPGVTDYIIDSGATGYLFGEADEYCVFVERLAADPRLRESIGEAARLRVEQTFDLDKIAAEYLSTYVSAAGRNTNVPIEAPPAGRDASRA